MASMNPVAAIVQPTAVKPAAYVGLASALCVLSAGLVSLRCWTNFNHMGKLHVDDYLSVLAFLFLIWNTVAFALLFEMLNSNPDDVTITHLTRLVAVGIASGNGAIYSAKLPLLFMLMRTFGIKKWLRWTCLFLIIFGTLGGVISLLYAGIACSPNLHEPTAPFLVSCVDALTDATVARGSLSLAIDVIVFILPLPIIVNLKMPLRKKIGLAFAFATGLLAIAASALCLYFQEAQSGGSSNNFANALLVSTVESSVVLMVSCTPGIHLFWTKYMGSLRTRLGITTTLNKSKLSDSNMGGTVTSKDGIQVRTDQYVELEDRAGLVKPTYEARALSVKQYV
ncbi:hypothetical protein BO78DRAFT_419980 [Aspergillus sclerotiicarbonarius CBS 121057]|uniref:Rhodopsin domain-containing protein n=1 Tax=Aspergillus sclerotiicarbonarius (strain CBS 121057 / IBT 28362) TaxID=1448318 RepID=A0A319E556_ASPSB|nr:hypothetical protein BO78DRAFT_419980 [Aspergillus sclerotiicarbonarius CBS 121057]